MDLIKKQRTSFTVVTTVFAAVFLLVLLGGFFGITCLANDMYMSAALNKALENPLTYNQVSPQNLRCFFVYVDQISGESHIKGDVDYYGDSVSGIIKAVKKLGRPSDDLPQKFRCGDRFFAAKCTDIEMFKVYAVLDRTSYRSQLINTALLTVLLYCCTVGLTALLTYLGSARLLRPVADAMQKQRDLTANASHELKTPLTVISANLSVLRSEPTSTVAENEHWIESIDSQITRMQELIQNMLELSKLESSAVVKEKLDLSSVTEGVCLSFEPVCFEKGVTLITDIADGATVEGDARALERLVGILLDNAIKYCGESGKVGLNLSCDQKKAKLSVMNTGESISKEEAEHVFDRFYRTDGARHNEDNKSFGLGLSIAYATVQAHGGTISCHGVEGKGSVFTVTLPLIKEKHAKKPAKKPQQNN